MSKKDMAAETVPGRFEVDLTSVCVRVGAVQLPFRLQNTFEEGPITAHDAAEANLLELQFRAPRKLTGLHGFFAAHGLRPNDRIALVFDESGLQIEAIRRERGAAGKAARPRSAPAGGNGADRLGDRPGASGSAPAGVDAAGRATASASTPTPVPGAAEPSGDEAPRPRARPEANAVREPERKRVVRERIRGNAPPLMARPDLRAGFESRTTAVTASSGKDGAASSGQDTVNGLPRWEPLDVMAPPGGWPDVVEGDLREAARAQGHGIVREVRRSRLGAARTLASGTAAEAASPRAADGSLRSGAQDAAVSTVAGAEESMRFSATAEDRDGLQAKALQRVLDRRSRPREAAEESRALEATGEGTTAAAAWGGTAASSPAYGVLADPGRGPRAQAHGNLPSRPVATPPAVTRSLNQRPITRTMPTQHGAEPAPNPAAPNPAARNDAARNTRDRPVPNGLIEGDDGAVKEHVLTGYLPGGANAAAEPATPWGPVDRLASVRVGHGEAGQRRSWTAAAQPLLQATAGLKRSLVPERSGEHDAVTSAADAGLSADPPGTREGQDMVGAGFPHHDDLGAGHDEPAGRGLDLFGLRKRLRRARNASDARADAGRTGRDDRRGARRHGNADMQGIDALDRPGEDVLTDDDSRASTSPADAGRTDDFSDAFLEFDEESRSPGGSAPRLQDVGNGRTRPWLDNGEYRPTETSPRQPGGHVAARAPLEGEAQQGSADDEAAHDPRDHAGGGQRTQAPGPQLSAASGAAAQRRRDQGKGASASRGRQQAGTPFLPSGDRSLVPDAAELPRSTGGRHAATKGYYDLSRLNEATTPRGRGQTQAPGESMGASTSNAGSAPIAPGTAAEPVSPSPSSARAGPQTAAGAPNGANDQAVVEGYLARPDVPAIVRSEAMADNIGMPLDRVERVMMRIAEDRERVTRIRPGAYLVRRKPTPKPDDGIIGPTA